MPAVTPPLTYNFVAPGQIVFGWGRRTELAALSQPFGRRAFIISGSRRLEAEGLIDEAASHLHNAGIEPVRLTTTRREPHVQDVDQAVQAIDRHHLTDGDFLIGIGGGSAMDLAKAVAAMATNRESHTVLDYLEGSDRGLKIQNSPLPLLTMPTTAGTGSEATKNAVISSCDPPFKKSLRSDLMMPRAVLIDPELSARMPPDITAHTGMDAITQLVESFISRRAQPIPKALALGGLRVALPALLAAYEDGSDRLAREIMAHAAMLSGLALANSGLGMAHGVAAALGVQCNLPHGLACAIMLPPTLRANRHVAAAGLAELGRVVCGETFHSDAAAADAFVHRVEDLCSQLQIPQRLSEVGVTRKQVPLLVTGSRGNSMSGNPRELSDAELTDILEGML